MAPAKVSWGRSTSSRGQDSNLRPLGYEPVAPFSLCAKRLKRAGHLPSAVPTIARDSTGSQWFRGVRSQIRSQTRTHALLAADRVPSFLTPDGPAGSSHHVVRAADQSHAQVACR
jgi:hypothetical protein